MLRSGASFASFDRAHSERPVDGRRREREAEERQKQARDEQRRREEEHQASNTEAWGRWVDGRIEAALARQLDFTESQTDILGRVVAELRGQLRAEFERPIAEMQEMMGPMPGTVISRSQCGS
jgi:hypothetical protein